MSTPCRSPTVTSSWATSILLLPWRRGNLRFDRARDAVRIQIAEPFALSIEEAAAGVVELFEDHLKNSVLGQVLGKGYAPVNYTMLSYGGGGPLHAAGYTRGLNFEDVLVPAWAAGFSAFGCACGDFEYRHDRTVDVPLLPAAGEDGWRAVAHALNAAWDSPRTRWHVHTMSDAIKWMIRHDYEVNPGLAAGDIFCNNDAMIGYVHNADVQTILPLFWSDELIGWAAGVTHVLDVGLGKPSGMPIGPVNRFEDGWILSCANIGARDGRAGYRRGAYSPTSVAEPISRPG